MNHPRLLTSWKFAGRSLAVVLLLVACGAVAYATLGDGKTKSSKPKKSLLSEKNSFTPGAFSLKSGYSFRGNQVINMPSERYINLNTVVTYQKGNATYIMPLKKRVLVDKITFNPNEATRRY